MSHRAVRGGSSPLPRSWRILPADPTAHSSHLAPTPSVSPSTDSRRSGRSLSASTPGSKSILRACNCRPTCPCAATAATRLSRKSVKRSIAGCKTATVSRPAHFRSCAVRRHRDNRTSCMTLIRADPSRGRDSRRPPVQVPVGDGGSAERRCQTHHSDRGGRRVSGEESRRPQSPMGRDELGRNRRDLSPIHSPLGCVSLRNSIYEPCYPTPAATDLP